MSTPGAPSDRSRSRIRLLDLLRLVFSAAALGLIVFGLFTMRESSRSRGWVRTDGRVVSSNVNGFTSKDGTTTYRPMVVYAYAVGSVRFMSNRIAFRSLASRSRDEAAGRASTYPAGSHVQVFYDPQDPQQAILDPGSNPWVAIIGGGVFSLLAVWMRILRGREQKRRTP